MVLQVDDFVPARILKYVGAAKSQATRSRFYIGFAQFAMIGVLFYNESATVQRLFPSMATWVIALVIFGLFLMALDFFVMLPSEITFNQRQSARENRNPTFQQVCENTRKLDELSEKLDERE